MSVEIIRPGTGVPEMRDAITFNEVRELVGGYVECVTIREDGVVTQCLMNEDGRMLGQPLNALATIRFRGKINNGPGAVGVWVVLKGKDLLK